MNAAQHETEQYRRDRKIERAQDDAVRHRKRGQQHADAEYQPGFIRVPESAD